MNLRRQLPIRASWAIICLFALPPAAFAQLKVIISGGFSAPYRELIPEFERTSGITVTTTSGGSQGTGPNTIEAQLGRGVTADVVILNKAGLADLIAHGKIVSGTEVDLAQTPLALAVRSGAPKPDISTVESFKQTLLRAKSVTFTSSTTGIYLTTKLFPRLGIADEMLRKSRTDGVAAVARGDAEIAIQALSELLPVAGIEVVATIPADVQNIAVFSAGVVTGSKDITASKQLIAFLSSPSATAAIRKSGMEPAKPR
jgi:molybdate transport system substrate-binding protein